MPKKLYSLLLIYIILIGIFILVLINVEIDKKLILEGEFKDNTIKLILDKDKLKEIADKDELIYNNKKYSFEINVKEENLMIANKIFKEVELLSNLNIADNTIIDFQIVLKKESLANIIKNIWGGN